MAQMVLPQTPAPGTQKDPGPSKSGASRDPADRKSDFESVSQAEQKRLDRQEADRNADAKSADESRSARDNASEAKAKSGDKPDAAQMAISKFLSDAFRKNTRFEGGLSTLRSL